MTSHGVLVEGQRVNVTGGRYKGKAGQIEKVTAVKVQVRLDGGDQTVCLAQNSIHVAANAAPPPPPAPVAAPARAPAPAPAAFTDAATGGGYQATLKPGDRIVVVGGGYEGSVGVLESLSVCKARVRLDGSEKPVSLDQKNVCAAGARTTHAASTCSESTAATMASSLISEMSCRVREEEVLAEDESNLFSILYRSVKKVILRDPKASEKVCFLEQFFKDRTIVLEEKMPRKDQELRPMHLGRAHELVSVKVEKDGFEFWGSPKYCARRMYVALASRSLQEELLEIADFTALSSGRKVASRLELMQRPGEIFEKTEAIFEEIEEPVSSKDSGGCGFIPESLLRELARGHGRSKAAVDKATAIQVRIFGPRLGALKGVLTLKPGITKIQYPPSMQKVPPSKVSSKPWVSIVVTKVFPSEDNQRRGKLLLQGACDSKKMKALSSMVVRVLRSLQVSPSDLKRYESQATARKEAWLVGVADPTDGQIPEGHVFVSGLSDHVPTISGLAQVFVTRCPCVHPADGLRLPVLTQRPPGMSQQHWQGLQQRPLGEIIFSGRGRALPESIASGDLDGDLYWTCWDESLVSAIQPLQQPDVPTTTEPARGGAGAAGRSCWLEDAQRHMMDPEAMRLGHFIGKLYNLAEKKAEASDLGLLDPDAMELFQAYVEAIDSGKHGNSINVTSPHLRKELKLDK